MLRRHQTASISYHSAGFFNSHLRVSRRYRSVPSFLSFLNDNLSTTSWNTSELGRLLLTDSSLMLNYFTPKLTWLSWLIAYWAESALLGKNVWNVSGVSRQGFSTKPMLFQPPAPFLHWFPLHSHAFYCLMKNKINYCCPDKEIQHFALLCWRRAAAVCSLPERQVAALPQLLAQVGAAGPVEQGPFLDAARFNRARGLRGHAHVHGVLPVHQRVQADVDVSNLCKQTAHGRNPHWLADKAQLYIRQMRRAVF